MQHDWCVHDILENRLQTGFQSVASALQEEKKRDRILQGGRVRDSLESSSWLPHGYLRLHGQCHE